MDSVIAVYGLKSSNDEIIWELIFGKRLHDVPLSERYQTFQQFLSDHQHEFRQGMISLNDQLSPYVSWETLFTDQPDGSTIFPETIIGVYIPFTQGVLTFEDIEIAKNEFALRSKNSPLMQRLENSSQIGVIIHNRI